MQLAACGLLRKLTSRYTRSPTQRSLGARTHHLCLTSCAACTADMKGQTMVLPMPHRAHLQLQSAKRL